MPLSVVEGPGFCDLAIFVVGCARLLDWERSPEGPAPKQRSREKGKTEGDSNQQTQEVWGLQNLCRY